MGSKVWSYDSLGAAERIPAVNKNYQRLEVGPGELMKTFFAWQLQITEWIWWGDEMGYTIFSGAGNNH